jgi:hypothetical protein
MNQKQGSRIKDLNRYSCDMRAEIFQVTGTITFMLAGRDAPPKCLTPNTNQTQNQGKVVEMSHEKVEVQSTTPNKYLHHKTPKSAVNLV